ncbi:MAG: YicC/YloC family endoribonuclease [Opitutales bacterium]
MTGYGGGAATQPPLAISVEVVSVNRRNLEIAAAVPREWPPLERLINDRARERFARGKLSVTVRVLREGNNAALQWDEAELAATIDKLKASASAMNVPFEPSADAFIRIVLSHTGSAELPDFADCETAAAEAVDAAFAQLTEMRRNEGATLSADLTERLQRLQQAHDSIAKEAPGSVERYRDLLFQRLRQAGLELDLDDERVLREIALFTDRCDISEELTRLASHLEQGRECLDSREPVGRKLDFLCQEIHRELNTIGSKANNLAITKSVIEAKNELERFREQVQNVE